MMELYDGSTLQIYGMTRQPETGNLMMVMQWCKNGDLRQNLNDERTFYWMYSRIRKIAVGLGNIHSAGLCHRDLHAGNILVNGSFIYIGNLGLCGPVLQIPHSTIAGVLPYIAPEVL